MTQGGTVDWHGKHRDDRIIVQGYSTRKPVYKPQNIDLNIREPI